MSRPKTYLTRERGKFLDFAAGQLRKLYGIETVDTATIAVTIHDMLAAVREQQYTPLCGECDRNECQHAPHYAGITQERATLLGMGPGEAPLAYQS